MRIFNLEKILLQTKTKIKTEKNQHVLYFQKTVSFYLQFHKQVLGYLIHINLSFDIIFHRVLIHDQNEHQARLIDQFKAIPSNASPKRLVKKYLEFCWSLPYYGRSVVFLAIYYFAEVSLVCS